MARRPGIGYFKSSKSFSATHVALQLGRHSAHSYTPELGDVQRISRLCVVPANRVCHGEQRAPTCTLWCYTTRARCDKLGTRNRQHLGCALTPSGLGVATSWAAGSCFINAIDHPAKSSATRRIDPDVRYEAPTGDLLNVRTKPFSGSKICPMVPRSVDRKLVCSAASRISQYRTNAAEGCAFSFSSLMAAIKG